MPFYLTEYNKVSNRAVFWDLSSTTIRVYPNGAEGFASWPPPVNTQFTIIPVPKPPDPNAPPSVTTLTPEQLEAVDDRVAAVIKVGAGGVKTYDDLTNELLIDFPAAVSGAPLGSTNVLDKGVISSTTLDQSAAIQALINSRVESLYFPPGAYKFSVTTLVYQRLFIHGGGDTTVFTAAAAGGYVIKLLSARGCYSNFKIDGANKTKSGIWYAGDGYDPNSGGLISNVLFEDCNIGVRKEGSLYARFYECYWRSGNKAVTAKAMKDVNNVAIAHAGFDQYINCQFLNHAEPVIYYNNTGVLNNCNTQFLNCWFEGNASAIYIAVGTGLESGGTSFLNCWNEQNTNTVGSVTIDGATYQLKQFILDGSGIQIDKMYEPSIEAINGSRVSLDNITVFAVNWQDKINISNNSLLGINRVHIDVLETVTNYKLPMDRVAGSFALRTGVYPVSPKTVRSGSYVNLLPWGSDISVPEYSGTEVSLALVDGVECLQVNRLTQGLSVLDAPGQSLVANKFYLLSFTSKTSTPNAVAGIVAPLSGRARLSAQWQTFEFIFEVKVSDSYYLGIDSVAGISYFADAQLVQFDSYRDAVNYGRYGLVADKRRDIVTFSPGGKNVPRGVKLIVADNGESNDNWVLPPANTVKQAIRIGRGVGSTGIITLTPVSGSIQRADGSFGATATITTESTINLIPVGDRWLRTA